jgi:superoxide dismutase, Cu-Zn family
VLFGMALLCSLAAYGCGTDDRQDTAAVQTPGTTPAAVGAGMTGEEMEIQLIDRQGQQVGTARLSQAGEGVQVALQVTGLTQGERGIHFHETGVCEAPSFQSAGAHFAPMGNQHGLQNPQGPHAGDMENLMVPADGTVNTTFTNPRVTLQPGQSNSLIDGDGTALLIHAERDDQVTDPSGDSGDRIVCGVIRRG